MDRVCCEWREPGGVKAPKGKESAVYQLWHQIKSMAYTTHTILQWLNKAFSLRSNLNDRFGVSLTWKVEFNCRVADNRIGIRSILSHPYQYKIISNPGNGKVLGMGWDAIRAIDLLIHTIADAITNAAWLGNNSAQKVAILVRVYNKPDSAITRIGKHKRRRVWGRVVIRQSCNMIAASTSLELVPRNAGESFTYTLYICLWRWY